MQKIKILEIFPKKASLNSEIRIVDEIFLHPFLAKKKGLGIIHIILILIFRIYIANIQPAPLLDLNQLHKNLFI